MFCESDTRIYHVEVRELLDTLFNRADRKMIRDLIEAKRNATRYRVLHEMTNSIDRALGGKGFMNQLCVKKDNRWTATYSIEDRPIFRPLQYAVGEIFERGIPHARVAVHWSCNHVESILKRKYTGKIRGVGRMSLGVIVSRAMDQKIINQNHANILYKINALYDLSKHDFDYYSIPEPARYAEDPTLFDLGEAISMLFICRKVGLILNPSLS